MKTIKLITENSYLKGYDEKGELCCHLPLNNSPILQGVDLLPLLEQEDDVEELAEQHCKEQDRLGEHHSHYCYIDGYNKAKERFRFTEEDIKNAFKHFFNKNMLSVEEIIQSLSQPKIPIGFECETITRVFDTYPERKEVKPKTTTTPEGHTQWVGTYIFN